MKLIKVKKVDDGAIWLLNNYAKELSENLAKQIVKKVPADIDGHPYLNTRQYVLEEIVKILNRSGIYTK